MTIASSYYFDDDLITASIILAIKAKSSVDTAATEPAATEATKEIRRPDGAAADVDGTIIHAI